MYIRISVDPTTHYILLQYLSISTLSPNLHFYALFNLNPELILGKRWKSVFAQYEGLQRFMFTYEHTGLLGCFAPPFSSNIFFMPKISRIFLFSQNYNFSRRKLTFHVRYHKKTSRLDRPNKYINTD